MKWNEIIDSLQQEKFIVRDKGSIVPAHDSYLEEIYISEEDLKTWTNNFGKLREILVQLKDSARLSYLAAVFYYNKDNENASKCFEEVTKLDTRNKRAYNNWAVVLGNLDKHQLAIEKCQKALEIDALYPDPYVNWGNALGRLGEHEDAIDKYQKALNLDARLIEAYIGWGVALSKRKRYKEAIEKYKLAKDIEPNSKQIYFNWGNALRGLDRFNEAFEMYQKAIEVDKSWAKVYGNWGLTLIALGRLDEAKVKLKIAKELFEKQGKKEDATEAEDLLKELESKK